MALSSLQEPRQRTNNAPSWRAGYRSCLDLAAEVTAISTIAFCGISTGLFAFPPQLAAPIALATINDWVAAKPERFTRIIIDCYTPTDATFYTEALSEW